MLVVDASVLAPFVADFESDGPRIRARLRGQQLSGPAIVKIETQSVLRRHVLAGSLDAVAAERALAALERVPIATYPAEPFLGRMWELRHSVTTYDACYVALAEVLDAVLLTGDRRLAGARGPECQIELA